MSMGTMKCPVHYTVPVPSEGQIKVVVQQTYFLSAGYSLRLISYE